MLKTNKSNDTNIAAHESACNLHNDESKSKAEVLTHGTKVYIESPHKFGADALLLAHFCAAKRAQTVCDLGTGCGIIPLRLFDRGHRGKCVAIDIEKAAIELLNKSVSENRAENIIPICMDLRSIKPVNMCKNGGEKQLAQHFYNTQFDVITCNPPYFTGGFVSPVKARANARHEETCTIEDVCKVASFLLKDGGKLCICQRPQRMADIICAMRNAKIEPKRVQFVTAQPHKEPWLMLIEGQKNSAPGLRMLPVLVTENPDGTRPSPAMRDIYEM